MAESLPTCVSCGRTYEERVDFDSEEIDAFNESWMQWPKDELGDEDVSFIDKERGEYRVYFGCETCYDDRLLNVKFVQPFSKDTTIRLNKDDLVLAQLQNGEWVEAVISDQGMHEVTLEWLEQPLDEPSNKRNKKDIKLVLTKTFHDEVFNVGFPYTDVKHFLHRNCGAIFELNVIVKDCLLVPQNVHETLNAYLDRLAAHPNPDFHPGSDGKVLDLIHPSLYCYVQGTSRFGDGSVKEYVENKDPLVFTNPRTGFFNREYEQSRYQWLPSEFQVSEEGKVDILSYINGLASPEQFPTIYRAVGDLFECFLPHFEQCLKDLEHPVSNSGLRGRKLQVICKAVDYILKPGETHQGVWHVEGMAYEHILATGIYYISISDHMKDEGLAFRRGIEEEEGRALFNLFTHDYPPPFDYSNSSIDLGAVQILQKRCIVFPNSYQHKVLGLKNEDDSDTAQRRIFCFFLVDPSKRIVSTQDIPDQRQLTVRAQLAEMLQKASIIGSGRSIPQGLMSDILCFAFSGMTLAEAKEHRLKLMHERKYQKDRMNQDIERQVSLCEH
jgi:hypothetical protein